MDSILQQLYSGDIAPSQQYRMRIELLSERRERIAAKYKEFLETLENNSPELSQQFQEIWQENMDYLPAGTVEMFLDGFRLGARMIMEVFMDED